MAERKAKREAAATALVAAALGAAAEGGWHALSLAAVAQRAGVGLAEAYQVAPSKAALLAEILASVDRKVLAAGPAEGESPRDRLFEVLMRRFDALQEQREGFRAILADLPADPLVLLPVLPAFARSMAWMLEAAGIPTHGVLGNLRTKALGAVYLNALRTWREDDSADLARTMAALDRGLRQLEALVERCPRLAGAPPAAAEPPPPAAEAPAATGTGGNGGGGFDESRPADA